MTHPAPPIPAPCTRRTRAPRSRPGGDASRRAATFRRARIALLGLAIAFAGLAPTAFGAESAAPPPEPPRPRLEVSPAQRDALGLELAPLARASTIARPPLPGRITVPNDRARVIATPVAGIVVGLDVATGDPVHAGAPLARIESPDFLRMQRELLEDRAAADLADAAYTRERQLVEEGIVAGRRAAESESQLRQARAVLAERRQALTILGMADSAIRELERTRRLERTLELRAPITGLVLEQSARVGERLDAGAELYRVGEAEELQVEIHVPIEIANTLAPGGPIRLTDAPGAEGRILAIGGDVHALDQGVLVRAALLGDPGRLRPGQFVHVELPATDGAEQAFEVPDAAVLHSGGSAFVFRAVDGGFESVAVRPLGGSGRRVVVAGDLAEGDVLVVRGTAALKAYWLSVGGPD